MKITNRGIIPFLFAILVLISCRRDLNQIDGDSKPVSMAELNIPIDFNWEVKQQVEVTVNLESTKSYQPKSKISIFSKSPEEGGKLYLTGSVAAGNSFTAKLTLPQYAEELYLVCEGPFGSVKHAVQAIENGLLNYTFSDVKSLPIPALPDYKGIAEGPDCNEGCDEYISGGGTVNINGGLTYCIQDEFDGKINFQNWAGGGTLRICGSAKIKNNQYLEANSNIIVAEGGTLESSKKFEFAGGSITIYQGAEVELDDIDLGNNAAFTIYEDAYVEVDKFNGWGNNAPLINYGTLEVKSNSYHASSVENYGNILYKKEFQLNGASFVNTQNAEFRKKFESWDNGSTIENFGEIYVEDDMQIGNNTLLTNHGLITADDGFDIYDNASLLNNGEINVSNNCDVSTNGDFTNNCQFTCDKNIEFSGNVKITLNTAYLAAAEEMDFWNSTSIDLYDNCMISAEDLVMQCDMNGEGAVSSVVVINDIDVWNNNDKFGGAIEVATTSGELNGGGDQNFTNGAYVTSIGDAVNYLPVSACNPEGFGTPTVVDMDFDGIPDSLDAYPNDPLRAFDSYFPNAEQYASVAFEDLWPSKGDYDFNDLVVAIEASYVSNANDLVVDLKFDFSIKAVGASFDNGFGFQLENVTPDMVQIASGSVLEQSYVNVAANGLEDDQNKAVVIVTESIDDVIHRPGGSFFNTVPGNAQGTSDTVNILITFDQPLEPTLVGLEFFNPFVIKRKERNVEIHLPNFPPTDLMDFEMFGTFDDASNPVAGTYYVTSTNLPWGMFLVEPFDYPVEKAQIIDAYNHFSSWAESGGQVYTDWYLNYSGYRNSDDIY